MKICVTASAESLESQVDPRFGRCQYFIIVNTDTMTFEATSNVSAGAMSGAGIQAAQDVVKKSVQAVITGSVGPNAFQVLSSAGIKILTGAAGTVREAVERFKKGQLQETTLAGPAGPGMLRGTGANIIGFGRGQGMGRGMGGFPAASFPQTLASPSIPAPPLSKEQEIAMLEEQMKSLQQQLELMKMRFKELKDSDFTKQGTSDYANCPSREELTVMRNVRVAVPTKGEMGLEDEVSETFGKSKTITVIDIVDEQPKNVIVLQNPAVSFKFGAGPILVKTLVDLKVNVVVTGELGLGASTLLEDHGIVKVVVKPGTAVSEAIQGTPFFLD